MRCRKHAFELLDRSLVLGETVNGIFQHDVVREYCRRLVPTAELHTRQRNVVRAILAAVPEQGWQPGLSDPVQKYVADALRWHMAESCESAGRREEDTEFLSWLEPNKAEHILTDTVTLAAANVLGPAALMRMAALAEHAEHAELHWEAALRYVAASRTDEMLQAPGPKSITFVPVAVSAATQRGADCLQAMAGQTGPARTAELILRSFFKNTIQDGGVSDNSLVGTFPQGVRDANDNRIDDIIRIGYDPPVTESGLLNLSMVFGQRAMNHSAYMGAKSAGNSLDRDTCRKFVQGLFSAYQLRVKILDGFDAKDKAHTVAAMSAMALSMGLNSTVTKHFDDEFAMTDIWPHARLTFLVNTYDAHTTPHLCTTMFYKVDFAGRYWWPSAWLIDRWGDVAHARAWLEMCTARPVETHPWDFGIDTWEHVAAGFADLIVASLKLRGGWCAEDYTANDCPIYDDTAAPHFWAGTAWHDATKEVTHQSRGYCAQWQRLVKFALRPDEVDMDQFVPWFDAYAIDDVFGAGPGVCEIAGSGEHGLFTAHHIIEVHDRLGRTDNAIVTAGHTL